MQFIKSFAIICAIFLCLASWADKYDSAPLHHAKQLLEDAKKEVNKKLAETKTEAPEHLHQCLDSINTALALVDDSIKWFEQHPKK